MVKTISFFDPPKTIILYQPRLLIVEEMQNPFQTDLNNKEDLLTHVTGRLRKMEDFSVSLS